MKKIYCLILFLISWNVVHSQVVIALLFGDKLNSEKLEFGLMVAPTYNGITNFDSKYTPGFDLGLYFNIKINDRLYLHPEALPKVSFGARDIPVYGTGNVTLDSLYADGSVKRKAKALSLPLLVRYRIVKTLFVEAGPQVNLTYKAKDIFETEIDGNKLSYENKITEQYNTFDVGYVLGLAYKLSPHKQSITLGVRYYGGLSDVLKNVSGKQANSSWMVNINIPIGGGTNNKKQKGSPSI